MLKSHWRRSHSADRTRSADARAGSRRNRRLGTVGAREKDYPRGWVHLYNCDGSWAGAECMDILHSLSCGEITHGSS